MQAETPESIAAPRSPHSVFPRLAVVGVGALGSEFCRQLAEAGAKNVLLVDPDNIEEHNLHTSPIYRQAVQEFGQPLSRLNVLPQNKAELMAAFVKHRFGLRWAALPHEIADVGLRRLSDYDVICCCGDSVLCRVETALAARTLGLPMLDGGVFGEGVEVGRATFFAAESGAACYLCGLAEARRAEILSYAASASLGCAAPQEAPPMTGASTAVERTAAAMIALLQRYAPAVGVRETASFAMRLSRERSSPAESAPPEWAEERLRLGRSSTCPWHERSPASLVALPWETPLSVAFAGEAAECILQCMWPVCLVAKCRRCGAVSRPARRVAWVRRRGRCIQCGTPGSLEPVECLDSIRAGDAAARWTPRELGMPEEHLYSFRPAWSPNAFAAEEVCA